MHHDLALFRHMVNLGERVYQSGRSLIRSTLVTPPAIYIRHCGAISNREILEK